jgi:hypothetical protein
MAYKAWSMPLPIQAQHNIGRFSRRLELVEIRQNCPILSQVDLAGFYEMNRATPKSLA